jgi:Tol biopolymer transport system component
MKPHLRPGLLCLILLLVAAALSAATLGAGGADAKSATSLRGEIALTGSTGICPSDSVQVYLFNVSSGKLNALTHGPVQHVALGWSPDGSRLLVNQFGPSGHQGLYSMRATGRSKTLLAKFSSAALEEDVQWSPGGHQVAYLGPPGTQTLRSLYVVNADGTHRRLLTHHVPVNRVEFFDSGDFSWAPNGKRIAFIARGAGGWRFVTVNTNGKPIRQPLSQVLPGVGWPTYSPDGSRIAFSYAPSGLNGPAEIAVAKIGPKPHHLSHLQTSSVFPVSPPVWSPNNSWIAVYSGNSTETVMRSDGTGTHTWKASWSGITFAPNSAWLAYVGGLAHDPNGVLYVANSDGSNPIQVLNDPSLHFDRPLWRGGTAEIESG